MAATGIPAACDLALALSFGVTSSGCSLGVLATAVSTYLDVQTAGVRSRISPVK